MYVFSACVVWGVRCAMGCYMEVLVCRAVGGGAAGAARAAPLFELRKLIIIKI